MITGFNPRDMYAADHIRRVLHTFPGVFEGIGEFTIHKEFVSDKVRPGPGEPADPALDSVLALAGEIGHGRDHPQRHRRAVPERYGEARVPGSDEGAARRGIRTPRSSGRTPASDASCAR